MTRFLGGLKEEIRSAIALHRPVNVQEASTLALLQEEEVELARRKASSKEVYKTSYRFGIFSDKHRQMALDKSAPSKTKSEKSEVDDKLNNLLSFKRKNGLLQVWGEVGA